MPVLTIACLDGFLPKCLLVLMLTLPEYLPPYLSSYQSGYLLAYLLYLNGRLPANMTDTFWTPFLPPSLEIFLPPGYLPVRKLLS